MRISSMYSISSNSNPPGVPLSILDDGQRPPLADRCGRTIDHLRLSVTSACNLRCLYCRPASRLPAKSAQLTDDQRLDLVRFLHGHYGLKQLRLTGGEPLLHPAIVRWIASVRSSAPELSLAMTTNACRLEPLAADLRAAGLGRLNISLDTIDPHSYRELTGGDLAPVLRGIDRAIAVGFPPPKLNTVVLAGVNDHQLADLVAWAFERKIEIRFLEAMPIGPAAAFNRAHFVGAVEIRRRLCLGMKLVEVPRQHGETAVRYVATGPGLHGTLGIIAPVTESFCGQCRRMRVTADGRLFPCLLDSRCVDLSTCWTKSAFQPNKADELIRCAVEAKRATGLLHQETAMIALGG